MTKIVNSMILTLLIMSFLMYFFSSHPMMMAFIVITQSIFMSSIISKTFSFSWYGFFMFIIYLGGILMLFSYIISLMTSEEPYTNFKKEYLLSFFLLFLVNMFKENKSYMEISTNKFSKFIYSSFSSNSMKLSIYLMLFLFFIMVVVVYMTEMSKGNMRKV